MLSIYILQKNNRIHAKMRLGKKEGWGGGGRGWRFRLGARLRERALENNEVFCFLYFYSSKK